MKGEINNNTIIVGDFNIPLTMDRSTKQKINKETQTLNDIIDQLDLIDIYRTFKVCVSLLIFCLVDLSIGVSGVYLIISTCISNSFSNNYRKFKYKMRF